MGRCGGDGRSARGRRGAREGREDSRELAGEFSSEESSDAEVLLAFEASRSWAWNGCSGMEGGVSRSGSEDASDIATSESSSAVGNANRFGRFAICVCGAKTVRERARRA